MTPGSDSEKEQRWRRTLAYGAERAKALGVTEADVPCLIAAYREKIAQGVRSLRDGKGADGEAFFAKMEAEFEELDRQGHK